MAETIVAALGVIVAGLMITVSVGYETWVAMTIWGWTFAPLPFDLLTGTCANIAVSLVVRSMGPSDDVKGLKLLKRIGTFYFVAPTIALATAWALLRLFR